MSDKAPKITIRSARNRPETSDADHGLTRDTSTTSTTVRMRTMPSRPPLLDAVKVARAANSTSLWRDQLAVRAFAGREEAIAAMTDDSCRLTERFLQRALDDPAYLTMRAVRRDYLEGPAGDGDLPVPFNKIMIATFYLSGMDIAHRLPGGEGQAAQVRGPLRQGPRRRPPRPAHLRLGLAAPSRRPARYRRDPEPPRRLGSHRGGPPRDLGRRPSPPLLLLTRPPAMGSVGREARPRSG